MCGPRAVGVKLLASAGTGAVAQCTGGSWSWVGFLLSPEGEVWCFCPLRSWPYVANAPASYFGVVW